MPFLIMRRSDIPNGALQVLDLEPNESQRNFSYQTPGQTKYVQNVPTTDTVATTGAGPITTDADYGGLAAYLIDNVEDQTAGESLTAAIANTAAAGIVGQATSSSEDLAAADIAGFLVGAGAGAGTSLTAGDSTGDLEELLSLLAGRDYVVPSGSEVEDAGNAFVADRAGDFTEGFRKLEDTSAFQLSLANGNLAGMTSATFNYQGTEGIAVNVFEDDGTRVV